MEILIFSWRLEISIFLVFYNIEDDDYHYNIYDFINKIYYASYYENKNVLLERYIWTFYYN
jgi:hypothetical protein